jgi:hypothetical protein
MLQSKGGDPSTAGAAIILEVGKFCESDQTMSINFSSDATGISQSLPGSGTKPLT